MIEAIIFDAETTGVKEPIQPIETAWVPFSLNNDAAGRPQATVARFKPSKLIELGALATHHILMEELENCPPHTEARVPECLYLIGHNIDFDWTVMGKPAVKRICTLALSRFLYPDLDSHKLGAMVYYTQGASTVTRRVLRDSHSAAVDIMLTGALLEHLVEKIEPVNMEDLWRFSEEARVPRYMYFGKFTGQPISAVDRGWAHWYRGQPNSDPYVLKALRREGKIA